MPLIHGSLAARTVLPLKCSNVHLSVRLQAPKSAPAVRLLLQKADGGKAVEWAVPSQASGWGSDRLACLRQLTGCIRLFSRLFVLHQVIPPIEFFRSKFHLPPLPLDPHWVLTSSYANLSSAAFHAETHLLSKFASRVFVFRMLAFWKSVLKLSLVPPKSGSACANLSDNLSVRDLCIAGVVCRDFSADSGSKAVKPPSKSRTTCSLNFSERCSLTRLFYDLVRF